MTRLLLVTLVSLALVSHTVHAACGLGNVDLSSLTKPSSEANHYTGTDGTYQYKMNVCGPAAGNNCGSNGYSVCQYQGPDFVASLGKIGGNNPVWTYLDSGSPAKGVKATYDNGDECWMEGTWKKRIVNVNFPCDASAKNPSTMTVSEDKATCVFTITLAAAAACPGSGSGGDGLSGGSVFLILLFTLVPVYIVAGCLYKRKKLGTQGKESCPNYDFWSTIPDLVKDGCRFSLNMAKSGCKSGRGDYTQQV